MAKLIDIDGLSSFWVGAKGYFNSYYGTGASAAPTWSNNGTNYYQVMLSEDGKAYVALPTWSNNSGDITGVTAGSGLTGGATSGAATLNVGAGTGISVGDDAVNLKVASTGEIGGIKIGKDNSGYAVTAGTSSISSDITSGKYYAVEIDKNDKAFVYVPWTDTDTKSFTITASASDDDVIVLTGSNGTNAVTYSASHAKKLGNGKSYTSGNTTTSISGSGGKGTIKIPQITVDSYGHVTAASDESVTITLPTLPTSLKNPNSLKFGSKTYDGSSAQEITAADLGLESALKYHGVTSTELTDGATTNPIKINNADHSATAGCVVIDSNSTEFVFDGTKWNKLGDANSYKTKQNTVSDPTASGNATSFIDTISQDTNGVITVTKKNVSFPTIPTALKSPYALSIKNSAGTEQVSYDGSATKTLTLTKSMVGLSSVENTALSAWTGSAKLTTCAQGTIIGSNNIGSQTVSKAGALTVVSKGSATQPIYWDKNGQPVACTYSLNKTVPSDAKFTDNSVTDVQYHYKPTAESADSAAELTATPAAAAGAYVKDTEYTVLTGIKVQRDAAGHVTGITYTAQNIKDTNSDTHHTAKNIVGASSGAKANAAVTSNGVYLNLIENSNVRSTHKISGTGCATVTSDSSGNISVNLPEIATTEDILGIF